MNIINKKNYNIKKNNISKNAIKVLNRLKKTGYQAYLVGGSVRDLLLGKKPKDFDVTTNATPEQLRKIFRNSRLVGKRFRIAHVMFRTEFIEVSTFRGNQKNISKYQNYKKNKKTINGMLLSDNTFGKIEEDAQRRDITINALYYDITNYSIRDYVQGISDLKQRTIRLIGDPETRYREDPIRILRVIRFSVQLNMKIEEKTAEPISRLANLLKNIPSARLFNEIIKLLETGKSYDIYQKIKQFNLFQLLSLFPKIKMSTHTKNLIQLISTITLKTIDNNIQKKINNNFIPEFFFSAILWYIQIEMTMNIQKEKKIEKKEAFLFSINKILSEFSLLLALPKQIISTIKEIWKSQFYIEKIFNDINVKLPNKKIFHQSCQLLLLRAETEKNMQLYKIFQYLINQSK
ncbi:Poly(A) polymerase I [Buchnera aphidicola (Eriosoma grossulariae)]|uniref:polynucleotide adenylyltransferase PcnB n=1 Tax=Buchnera aphidicola TaxID=9 RepID=UPI00346443D0